MRGLVKLKLQDSPLRTQMYAEKSISTQHFCPSANLCVLCGEYKSRLGCGRSLRREIRGPEM